MVKSHVNIEQKFIIEPHEEEWAFKEENGHFIIKKDKHKNLLKLYASSFCESMYAELIILDKDREIEEKINFYKFKQKNT